MEGLSADADAYLLFLDEASTALNYCLEVSPFLYCKSIFTENVAGSTVDVDWHVQFIVKGFSFTKEVGGSVVDQD